MIASRCGTRVDDNGRAPVRPAIGRIGHEYVFVVRGRVVRKGHVHVIRVGVVHGDGWSGESVAVVAAVKSAEAVGDFAARELGEGAHSCGEARGGPRHLRRRRGASVELVDPYICPTS